MKAVFFETHGGPEVLQYGELPTPEPGPGEVRVRLTAAGVNHLDIWVRKGLPGLKLEYPHIPGADGVGVVDALGPGVADVQPGEKVVLNPGISCGHCEMCLSGRDPLCREYNILGEHRKGTYAEYVVVPRANLLPFPKGLSDEEAAAFPLVFLTAWQMVERAQVRPGEWVLITAIGSGVSTAALQITKLFGARVIAASSQEWKLERARAMGADETILTTDPDFVRTLRKKTGGGPQVVLDHVGEALWENLIRGMAWGGRLVTCGATSGPKGITDIRHVFYRQLSILGSTMGSKGSLFRVVRLMEEKKLRPVVGEVLPLEQAAQAHRLLEERKVFGKVVLRIS